MIIKRITIRNFRSYYGENTFDFSDGLTLIIGDNGDGKTTFFEALQWLFNTTVDTPIMEHFSEMRKSELELGESDTVSVSITFDHYGMKTLEKSFVIERYADNKFRPSAQQFHGYEDKLSGRDPVEGKALVHRCFDAFLQRFSMFKGESDLNVFNDPAAFQQLIEKYSDLREFDKYVSYTEEFERKANSAFIKESKSDEKISKQVEEYDRKLLDVRRRIQFDKRDLIDSEKAARDYQGKIENLEKNQDASEKYNEIKNRIQAKESEVNKLKAKIEVNNFNINLLDKLWILCAYTPILKEFQQKSAAYSKNKRLQNEQYIKECAKEEGKKETIAELTQLANGASRMPWYLPGEAEMEEMLHDHICKVCGREAPEGSEPYKFMVEKLEEYRKHIKAEAQSQEKQEETKKELFENDFIEEIHSLSHNLGGFNETEVTGKVTEILGCMKLVNRFKADLDKAQADLREAYDEKARILIQADGVSEEMLDKSFHDLRGYFEEKSKAENNIIEIKGRIKEKQDEERYYIEQIEALAPDKGRVKVYKKVYEVLNHIHQAFIGAKENNLTIFLQKLEDRANEYLSQLSANDFHGIVRLIRTADNSADIQLWSSKDIKITNPSGSQQTTMYMSVLFAISDLTTLNKEQDYPLIFDAATSSFGDAKEDDFYNIIDSINKQCIIVTKDFLDHSEIRINDINKLTCSVYRIKKADGYDKSDLSTIRTTVTKIK